MLSRIASYEHRPVIPILFALIIGILIGACLPDLKAQSAIIIISGIACVAWLILFRTKHVTVCLAIFAFAWGYASICGRLIPVFPDNHAIHYAEGKKKRVVGRISTHPVMSENRAKLVMDVVTIDDNTTCGKIRLTVLDPEMDLFVGDTVSFSGKLRRPHNFNNPGGFDYERHLAFQGIWVTSFVKGPDIRVLERSRKSGIGEIVGKFRIKIARLIDEKGRNDTKGVLKALIVGDRSDIRPDTLEAFRRAGVSHILAISGLHIGIVATVSFFFLKMLFSRVNVLLWKGAAFKSAAVCSIFPVLAYGLIAGFFPSTQRAVIMVIVFLSSFIFGYERDTMHTVAFAALAILIADPPALFSISFQLSFSAVVCIVHGMNLIFDSHAETTIVRRIIQLITMSVIAILGTLPLTMYHFNQVSVGGIVANLVVIPIVGFVVVPLGLLGVFIFPAGVTIAGFFMTAASYALWPVLKSVSLFAAIPYCSFRSPTPTILEISCYYALLWAVATFLFDRPNNNPITPDLKTPTRMRMAKAVALAAALILVADAGYWIHRRYFNPALQVTVIDVGQGSAALVEVPFGQCVLIDGGGFYDSSVFDVGANIVAPFLWGKRIRTVDTIILSHPHADHMNGLGFIAEHFNVKDAFLTNHHENPENKQDLVRILRENGARMPRYDNLPESFEISGVTFSVLHPPRDFLKNRDPGEKTNHNNDSMVVKVAFGNTTFLFPGDIEAEPEHELSDRYGNALKSRVLIAPHHGSRTSSTDVFLANVAPEIVVVSCGYRNRFGYPHPPVIKRYEEKGCRILRTDLQGAVTMATDGKTLRISPYLK